MPSRSKANEEAPSIVSVTNLTTVARDGFGLNIVIENPGSETLFVVSTCLDGRIERRVAGATSFHQAVTYNITLNAHVQTQEHTTLEADVSEPDEEDWIVPCKGEFTHEFSTNNGHRLWEYRLCLDTPAEIPASSRIKLRLLFRRGKRSVAKEVSKGAFIAATVLGERVNDHGLTIKCEGKKTLRAPVNSDFLSFIANW